MPDAAADLPSGCSRVPAGNAVSSTHCCPPQSKPSSSSLHPTLTPSLQQGTGKASTEKLGGGAQWLGSAGGGAAKAGSSP